MLFLTHVMVGVLVALVGLGFLSGGNSYVFFFVVLIGACLPDIDQPGSKMNQWTGIIGKSVSFFFKHRGFFHSMWLVVIVVLAMRYFFGSYYAWGLFLGMVSHLVSDGMTRAGVDWFYPLRGLQMRGFMKTGSTGEIVVQIVLVGLIVWKVVG